MNTLTSLKLRQLSKVRAMTCSDRVIEERVEDISGNVQTRITYSYDVYGNVSQ